MRASTSYHSNRYSTQSADSVNSSVNRAVYQQHGLTSVNVKSASGQIIRIRPISVTQGGLNRVTGLDFHSTEPVLLITAASYRAGNSQYNFQLHSKATSHCFKNTLFMLSLLDNHLRCFHEINLSPLIPRTGIPGSEYQNVEVTNVECSNSRIIITLNCNAVDSAVSSSWSTSMFICSLSQQFNTEFGSSSFPVANSVYVPPDAFTDGDHLILVEPAVSESSFIVKSFPLLLGIKSLTHISSAGLIFHYFVYICVSN